MCVCGYIDYTVDSRFFLPYYYSISLHRDNCLLVHQMQHMGTGALGWPAVQAAKHAAAKHGVTHIVWAGTPPPVVEQDSRSDDDDDEDPLTTTSPSNFSAIFQNCPVAMAIATLGGTIVDCNERFCQALCEQRETLLTGTPMVKSRVPAKTIFNLTAKEDLQNAFAQISDWLTPPADQEASSPLPPIVLRTAASTTNNGAVDRNLRLCLTPIQRPQDKTLRFLCVTLVNDNSASCPTTTAAASAATLQPFSFTPLPFETDRPQAPAVITTDKDTPAQIKANFMAVG